MIKRNIQEFITGIGLFSCALLSASGANRSQLTAAEINAGGTKISSSRYSMTTSIGGTFVQSTTNSRVSLKSGFIGTLKDFLRLRILSTNTPVNEGASFLATAIGELLDGTTVAIPQNQVTWTGDGIPLVPSFEGTFVAARVAEDTTMVLRGDYQGLSNSIAIAVIDINPDDFPGFSGDAITDRWQVQYFGSNTTAGRPEADPDGDSQNNLQEFAFGSNPNDENSKSSVSVQIVEDGGRRFLSVGMRRRSLPNRLSYRISVSDDIDGGSWADLSDRNASGQVDSEGFAQSEYRDTQEWTEQTKARFFRILVAPK